MGKGSSHSVPPVVSTFEEVASTVHEVEDQQHVEQPHGTDTHHSRDEDDEEGHPQVVLEHEQLGREEGREGVLVELQYLGRVHTLM